MDQVKTKKETIAIIGAGPSGLACAYFLGGMGYKTEIFDENAVPGGLPIYAVPSSRIHTDTIMNEVENLKKTGAVFHNGVKAGGDINIDSLFKEGFDAIFIGAGLWKPAGLDVPGINLKGVYAALDFLIRFNIYDRKLIPGAAPPEAGDKVVVIGGGNVAIDSILAVKSLGAKDASILCLEAAEEMPSYKNEWEEALALGAVFYNRARTLEITGENGRVSGVKAVKVALKEGEKFGIDNLEDIPGSEFFIEADTVIEAVGQRPDEGFTSTLTGVDLTERGLIKTDAETLKTSRAGVFAGGDIAEGPSNIAVAIKDGKKAASSIDKYLKSLKAYGVNIA
ncbi:MAG: FAD-dependent oxidoreductase [Chloroflexi bacterium]|nr:FAD-dependent oxidoreductase [Chloroflexota bacterium]